MSIGTDAGTEAGTEAGTDAGTATASVAGAARPAAPVPVSSAASSTGREVWVFTILLLPAVVFLAILAGRLPEGMEKSLGLAGLAFFIGVLAGPHWIRLLRRIKVGERISSDVPDTHRLKAGTPTMGGVLFLVTIVVLTAVYNLVGHRSMLLPLGTVLSFGALGMIDDLAKLRGRRVAGLTRRVQLLLHLLIAGTASYASYHLLGMNKVYVPFFGAYVVDARWYVPFATLVIIATLNAMAITDGLDGLLAGTSAIAFAAYWIISVWQGLLYLGAFNATVMGALLAFLWFNVHPARMFMGNTGSMALGGLLGVVALMSQQPLLLPLIGIVFVANAVADLIQIGSFQLRKRRVFRRAPLHHHFELLGWHEVTVTLRFWIVGAIAAVVALMLATQ
ncbi:MAG: phospho-N-acetylmuramoyl-pentapeptide-transferase [Chloroflexota bacterium]